MEGLYTEKIVIVLPTFELRPKLVIIDISDTSIIAYM